MNLENKKPDIKISVRQTFGIDTDMEVDSFSEKNPYVPELDENYKFDRDTTLAILSGFAFNKRVLIQNPKFLIIFLLITRKIQTTFQVNCRV